MDDRRRWLTAGLAALMAAGCSDPTDDTYVPRDVGHPDDGGAGEVAADGDADADADADGDATAEVDAACVEDLDIVFVLDVSTSMTPVLDALSRGVGEVWSAALGLAPDTRFGLVVFVDDVMVTRDGEPYGSVVELQDEFGYWRDFCSSNDEPGGSAGFNTDCPENALDAIWAAATSFAWREDALRMVIVATDDTFVERPDTLGSAGIMVQHTYAEVLDELRAREIRVAAFAAHDSSNCSIPPVHDTEPGFFSEWGGLPPLPSGTGAEVFDIQAVRAGTLSMTEAINDVILDEYCTPYIY
ncbi:MAG: VWA domain-containing protein [Deltaproteobacteria bacterium]|nr:VWA domain-containing protein [Deltaproteobacteria bacterium]